MGKGVSARCIEIVVGCGEGKPPAAKLSETPNITMEIELSGTDREKKEGNLYRVSTSPKVFSPE